jgi:hypothetical protein
MQHLSVASQDPVSAGLPAASPVSASAPLASLSWVDANFPAEQCDLEKDSELEGRIRAFLAKHDPVRLEHVERLLKWALVHTETALNAKLLRLYKAGLPLPKAGSRTRAASVLAEGTSASPLQLTLREQIRGFLARHDKSWLAEKGENAVDALLKVAASKGFDVLNSTLASKYGGHSLVEEAAPEAGRLLTRPELDKQASFNEMLKATQKLPRAGSFVEVALPEEASAQEALRPRLKRYYLKHDASKLPEAKFAPILQWGLRIGPEELDRKLQDKYGESLSQLAVQDEGESVGGSASLFVMHGARADELASQVPAPPGDSSQSLVGCGEYVEKAPFEGFGVCACGLSRIDHFDQPSILVAGAARPAHKPTASAAKQAPATSPPAAAAATIRTETVLAQSTFRAVQIKAPTKVVAAGPAPAAPTLAAVVKEQGMDGPCANYNLDLTGSSFGVCKCGWSRADHNKVRANLSGTLEKKWEARAVA